MATYRIEFTDATKDDVEIEADDYAIAGRFVSFKKYDSQGIAQDLVASFAAKTVLSVERAE